MIAEGARELILAALAGIVVDHDASLGCGKVTALIASAPCRFWIEPFRIITHIVYDLILLLFSMVFEYFFN